MKQILYGKMYDTDKAELILEYGDERTTQKFYKTKNGAFLQTERDRMKVLCEDEIKYYLGVLSPSKYIELFGEVEEG